MNISDKFALGLLMFVVALVLLQKPKCRRGCKTLGEHLLTDGFDEMIAALLA